jgi:hypothetical protein
LIGWSVTLYERGEATTTSVGSRLSLTSLRKGVQVNSTRKLALATGMFFIVTFIAAIGGLVLYGPVLNDPNYIVGAGADTRVLLGAFSEVILAIAVIGTSLTMFPIVKRQS